MSSCSSDCTALNCYFLPSLLHLVLVNYILWLSLVTPYSVYLCEVSESYCHTMCLSIYIYTYTCIIVAIHMSQSFFEL